MPLRAGQIRLCAKYPLTYKAVKGKIFSLTGRFQGKAEVKVSKRVGVTVIFLLLIGGAIYLVIKGHQTRYENRVRVEEPGLSRVREYRDELLDQAGSSTHNKQALREVIERYEDYIEEHPDSARAYNDLGDILYDYAGQPHEAAKNWQRAVQIDPDFAEARNNLGVYYDHFGEPLRGIEEVRKAIQLDPHRGDYHYNLAVFYFVSRYEVQKKYGWDLPKIYAACLDEHKKAIVLEPENYEFSCGYARTFSFARFFQVETDYDAAIAAWKHCLGLDIDDGQKAQVLLHMAHLSMDAKRPDQARTYANEILKIKPDHAAAKRLLERLSRVQRNFP